MVLQVFVRARDFGSPSNTSPNFARVDVTVIRNTAPQFVGMDTNTGKYSTSIRMDQAPGSIVFQTTVVDADTVVGSYCLKIL